MSQATGKIEYTLIRSDRKTLGIEIARNGDVIVRAPQRTSKRKIEALLREKTDWIARARAKVFARAQAAAAAPLTEAEADALRAQARTVLSSRVAHFAPLIGVDYGKITIRMQRTRWGSCSARGDLSFNCLLMLAPPEAVDSVVVHELCHRRHMDHSPAFYDEVLRVFPDYRKWHKWLKDNGPLLLARAEGAK